MLDMSIKCKVCNKKIVSYDRRFPQEEYAAKHFLENHATIVEEAPYA